MSELSEAKCHKCSETSTPMSVVGQSSDLFHPLTLLFTARAMLEMSQHSVDRGRLVGLIDVCGNQTHVARNVCGN